MRRRVAEIQSMNDEDFWKFLREKLPSFYRDLLDQAKITLVESKL